MAREFSKHDEHVHSGFPSSGSGKECNCNLDTCAEMATANWSRESPFTGSEGKRDIVVHLKHAAVDLQSCTYVLQFAQEAHMPVFVCTAQKRILAP